MQPNNEKNEQEPPQQPQSMRDRIQSLYNYRSEPAIGDPKEAKPLAVITLDIGEKTEIVKIFEGDDIKKKAMEITKKHNLAEEAVDFLIENINAQIKSSVMEKSSANHLAKNSIETTNELNLNNKSLAEIQYENWQKILQQKSQIKHENARKTQSPKPEMNSYGSAPNFMHHHLNNSKDSEGRNASIYEKLYQAALYSQSRKKENSKISIETKILKENKESTFKPKINNFRPKDSKNTSVSPIRNAKEISEYLYNDGKKYMERKKRTEKIKEEIELEKCPFKPNISRSSQILVENQHNKSPYKSIHEKLYKGGIEEENQREIWRKKNFNLYYPFQPNVCKEETNVSILKKEGQDEFINRLVNSKKIRQQNEKNIKIKDMVEIDKKTGQELFKPVITKDQYYFNVKAKENNEYEDLRQEIRQNLKGKEKRKKVIEREKINKTDNQIKLEKNKNVKEDKMTKLLREIFDMMDDDKDKFISSKHIDLSEIDPYFLEIIQEILYEMEEKKEKMDFYTFLGRIKEYGFDKRVHDVMII